MKTSKDYYENQYLKAYNSPKILHYCGHEKPWTHPHYTKSYIWWEYARKTPFYEQIIYKNIKNENKEKNIELKKIIVDGIYLIFYYQFMKIINIK